MTTINQTYPPVAGYATDAFNPDVVLIGCDHQTASYAMPANTAFVQYEIAKIDPLTSALVKLTAAPAAGDILTITAYAADNLTATAAALRTTAVHGYVDGDFNETKLVYPAGVTADQVRAIARQSDLILRNPLVRN
jgi:hypothetical protein